MRAAYKRAHQTIVASAQKATDKNTAQGKRSAEKLAKTVKKSNPKAHAYIQSLIKPEKLQAYKTAQTKAVFNANQAAEHGPITYDEAKSLKRSIIDLAGNGFPFDVVDFGVDTTSGRIRCYITLLHPKNPSAERLAAAAKALKATLATWTLKSDRAARSSSTGLATYTLTSPKHPHLVGAKAASQSFLANFGLTRKPTYHAALYHLGAIEKRFNADLKPSSTKSNEINTAARIAARDNATFKNKVDPDKAGNAQEKLAKAAINQTISSLGQLAKALGQVSGYEAKVAELAADLTSQARNGKRSWFEVAKIATKTRSDIFTQARDNGDRLAKALLERTKLRNQQFRRAITAVDTFERGMPRGTTSIERLLTKAEFDIVAQDIEVEARKYAPKAEAVEKLGGRFAKGLFLLTLGIAVYEVYNSDRWIEEAGRQLASFGGGVGGMATGAALGALCGPGAPICMPVGAFFGGLAGGLGAEWVYDWALDQF